MNCLVLILPFGPAGRLGVVMAVAASVLVQIPSARAVTLNLFIMGEFSVGASR